MGLEKNFDAVFAARLALKEKQIQQNYRPIIGIHKWFARRPGTLFRSLLLSEFDGCEPLPESYWQTHKLKGVIADPFMGGGTPVFEASRLGFSIIAADVNPMAYWIVRQSLAQLDLPKFLATASRVVQDVAAKVDALYQTTCISCGADAQAKYFLWVKTEACPNCSEVNDLFPGYLLAEAVRHPKNVLVCSECGTLGEFEHVPTRSAPSVCKQCAHSVYVEGPAHHGKIECRKCSHFYRYMPRPVVGPPKHRMWAIEYHCSRCKPRSEGRFFKRPDADDMARSDTAKSFLLGDTRLPIPNDRIPKGDETDRLHRWGYERYREMFCDRQLAGLGLLLHRIREVQDATIRQALLTIFSDFLRYQNMLCRYDTYALKCQDVFSVHGFPVGLVQCENNLLGIRRVGSGSFRHFIEKFCRAKAYCEAPFETQSNGRRKKVVVLKNEQIGTSLVDNFPHSEPQQAWLICGPAHQTSIPPCSLDGVFTDPPYFANVQYAELMDFCYVWLRIGLQAEFKEFQNSTTRTPDELTGNLTLGRDLQNFTEGLSRIFQNYAAALKPGAPFVFTYHHNKAEAYIPIVVSILDAGLNCYATLPAAAEMTASLHIAGTGSSTLDSVFVCRTEGNGQQPQDICAVLSDDAAGMGRAGVRISEGDLRCLAAGHSARVAVNRLAPSWEPTAPLQNRMALAGEYLQDITSKIGLDLLIPSIVASERQKHKEREALAAAV